MAHKNIIERTITGISPKDYIADREDMCYLCKRHDGDKSVHVLPSGDLEVKEIIVGSLSHDEVSVKSKYHICSECLDFYEAVFKYTRRELVRPRKKKK
jgi:hypothetical protein